LRPLIIITNDDGIESHGLIAAVQALHPLADLLIAAPAKQMTAMGRALPNTMSGTIHAHAIAIPGETVHGWAVDGSPAQAVQFAVLEIAPKIWGRKPDLVVSGINYGENIGNGITISGTIGAALEAASFGVRALAVSLETHHSLHHSNSPEINFSSAAYFTRVFAEKALRSWAGLQDVQVFKVDVPDNATPATPWQVVRQSSSRYYQHVAPQRASWQVPGRIGIELKDDWKQYDPETDIYTLAVRKWVSVVPLSLELTSRTAISAVKDWLAD